MKRLNIMGTRGVPATHGGYEYFAAHLAPYMVERGWQVTVYCQDDAGEDGLVDEWRGVERVHFVPRLQGTAGTMEFDWKTVRHVLRRPGVDLVLGYNTAVFNLVQRLAGRKVAMNMDGIEWQREKWSLPGKIWFFLNELAGANLSNLPIADHPEMHKHLRPRSLRRRIATIPYGSDLVTEASEAPVRALGLEPGRYLVKIARAVPENSVLEIIRAFSSQHRWATLVVLGRYEAGNAYHDACRAAASEEVLFPGPIFEPERVQALRFHARAYLHGHTVGGTNPSLCEALGAGNAVIAHDNRFNRWTAGPDQIYFSDVASCSAAIDRVLNDDAFRDSARAGARRRHAEAFTWPAILSAYEAELEALATR